MNNKEEQIITFDMVKHAASVFRAKKHRRLIAGGITAAAALIVLRFLPDLYGYPAGTLIAVAVCRMLAWFSAVSGMAVLLSNIRKFDLTRYIAAAVTCAVVMLILISACDALSSIDLGADIDSFYLSQVFWYGIVDNLLLFFAALNGSVLVGYVFGRKRA